MRPDLNLRPSGLSLPQVETIATPAVPGAP
jgi:hypothetical protein